jgi:hypothetical protein
VSKTKWDGVAGEPSIRVQVERSVNHLLQRLNRRIQVPRSETQMILAWKTISFHKKRSTFHRKSKEFVENQCEITIFRWFDLFFWGKFGQSMSAMVHGNFCGLFFAMKRNKN